MNNEDGHMQPLIEVTQLRTDSDINPVLPSDSP